MSTDPARANIEPTDASAQLAPCVRFDGVSIGGADDGWSLSFALAPGSFHWLTGAAPGLRSAFLRLISLAQPPARGLVQLFGRDVSTVRRDERLALRRRVGSAGAPPCFFEHLSVWDNAALVPRIAGRAQGDYKAQVDEVLAWVGLGRLADHAPSTLNAEQKARLALARAIANRPEILVIDGLDEDLGESSHQEAATGVTRLLTEIHHAGITVIAACRDPAAAARSGYPVLHLRDGRVSALESFSHPAGAREEP
jgi:cell division transport system ATP-binding protein